METTFFIDISMRTANGFKTFSKFFLGNDSSFAYTVFGKLRGNKNTSDNNMLQMTLREIKHGIPLNVKMLNCSLEELAENCKIIVKEVFKCLNLGNM